MTIEKVRKGMTEDLDWHAHEYLHYNDDAVKQGIADDFKRIARSYNGLLKNVYGDEAVGRRFYSNIIRYIQERNEDDWE